MQINDYMKGRRALRSIKRFGMEFTIRDQNLCDHGYNVATLFYLLCKEMGVSLTASDMFIALQHDFVESMTGDLNKMIKDLSPETADAWDVIEQSIVPYGLQYLTRKRIAYDWNEYSQKTYILQISDALEALIYCYEERAMGNSALSGAIGHYSGLLYTMTKDVMILNSIIEEIKGGFQ